MDSSLDTRVPVLGPLDRVQATNIQLPDGTVLVELDGLDKVLGAGSGGLSGMLIEQLSHTGLNIQPRVELVHQGGLGNAGVDGVGSDASDGGQFLKGIGNKLGSVEDQCLCHSLSLLTASELVKLTTAAFEAE